MGSRRHFRMPARLPLRPARAVRRRDARVPLAGARPLQLGARLLRRLWPRGNDAAGAVDRRRGRQRARSSRSPSCRERCNRVANFLRGARRAARRPRAADAAATSSPLWETMLGGMKLGAVVIPATTLLDAATTSPTASSAARVRHVVTDADGARKFADAAPGDYTRIVVGVRARSRAGTRYEARYAGAGRVRARRRDAGQRSAAAVLHLRHDREAEAGAAHHQSYPVGHLSTMYWIGLQPGDVHWNISSPGWAKHAWSCFFAPWNAGATVFVYNYARFDAQARARRARALRRDDALRAADRVAHADPGGPGALDRVRAARAGRRRRAAQPGGHRAGARTPGASRSATATARPRRRRRSATRRASR